MTKREKTLNGGTYKSGVTPGGREYTAFRGKSGNKVTKVHIGNNQAHYQKVTKSSDGWDEGKKLYTPKRYAMGFDGRSVKKGPTRKAPKRK